MWTAVLIVAGIIWLLGFIGAFHLLADDGFKSPVVNLLFAVGWPLFWVAAPLISISHDLYRRWWR